MLPIFANLDMMRRALQVDQTAIQTTGHNISNANTEGYSRQRVNLSTWIPYPAIGINADRGAGQIGTGVIDDSIVRIRDQFTDQQVRDNTNLNGYWGALSDAYDQMQDIVNEPTDTGISSVLDDFWQSLQDMSSNTGTSATGTTVLENAKKLTDTFNYIAESLGKVQSNTKNQIGENVKLVNNYADQINELNKNIEKQEANGQLPNDLYDQRDALVDKLSQIVNIKVTKTPSGGQPSKLAEGKYTIEIVDQNGASFSKAATLVDGKNLKTTTVKQKTGDPSVVYMDGSNVRINQANPDGKTAVSSGKLQGLIDAYTTDYPQVMESLDNMAKTLAQNFNDVYKGTDGDSNAGYDSKIGDFFTSTTGTITAATIQVNSGLSGDNVKPNKKNSASGDNDGAAALADVIATNKYDIDNDGKGNKSTLKGSLEDLIGQIGVNGQKAEQFTKNSQTTLDAATNRRSSISGVSMDEELTNLIQFQHSYSAAARVVTTLDTMLDTLINKMG